MSESVEIKEVIVRNPLSPQNLIELYINPKSFFSNTKRIVAEKQTMIATFIIGIIIVVDRMDSKIADGGIEGLVDLLENKISYVGFLLLGGLISALLFWSIGGWWYKLRLSFSGVESFDHDQAQDVFIFSSLIYALPLLITLLINLVIYPNPIVAFNEDNISGFLALIFLVWSIIVSYLGVTEKFQISNIKVKVWFLLLPLIVNFGAFALIVTTLLSVEN